MGETSDLSQPGKHWPKTRIKFPILQKIYKTKQEEETYP